MVTWCWDHDRERVARLDQRGEVVERADAEFTADLVGPFRSHIMEPDEAGAGQLSQYADVMVAERAGADDTDPGRGRAQTMIPRSLSSRKRRKCSTSGERVSSVAAFARACDTFSSERKNSR
jgi:hypothetical protein